MRIGRYWASVKNINYAEPRASASGSSVIGHASAVDLDPDSGPQLASPRGPADQAGVSVLTSNRRNAHPTSMTMGTNSSIRTSHEVRTAMAIELLVTR
jgi:hypothetical protein